MYTVLHSLEGVKLQLGNRKRRVFSTFGRCVFENLENKANYLTPLRLAVSQNILP